MQVVLMLLLGLASGSCIAAGILVIQRVWRKTRQNNWLLLTAVFILLAAAPAFHLFQVASANQPDLSYWFTALLFLLIGGGACVAVYFLGQSVARDWSSRSEVSAELERYRLSFDKGPEIIVIKDAEGVYISANAAYQQFLGKKDHELVGESDANFFPRSQAAAFRQLEKQALDSGATQTKDEELRGVDGVHWFRMSRVPLRGRENSNQGILVFGQEITDQKQAETTLSGWKQGLTNLADAELAIADLADTPAAWESLLTWACKLAGCEHGAIWMVDTAKALVSLKMGCGKLAASAGVTVNPREGIAGKVWQNGQPVLMNDYQSWPDRGSWSREHGFTTAIGLPVKLSGQAAWILTLFADAPGAAFREDQLQVLTLFCQLASSNLQKNERFAASVGNLGERQQALGKLQYRVRLEHMVALIAAHFITLDPDKADESIERSLQTLARFAVVDRCYMVLFPRDGSHQADLPAWYTSEKHAAQSLLEDFARVDFRWFMEKLGQFELIHIPHIKDLLAEDTGAVGYLQSKGIKSFTAVPLVSKRSLLGYLGIESLHAETEWSEDILALMKTCGEIFVGLLERKWSVRETRDEQEKVRRQISLLEKSNHEGLLITEMGDLLQACRTADEAYPIITRYIPRLIQAETGVLYMLQDSVDPAEKVAEWGRTKVDAAERELVLNECWGMRRGRVYAVQDPAAEPVCGHIKTSLKAGYLCVPLLAHGVAVGLLHLRQPADTGDPGLSSESQQKLAVKIAEYIAMALTNLKLRDGLRGQAIRDPLTGLFNRRYMEETLDREIRRAARHSTPVSIIMFDIDKLKPINDQFGHDAGDLVLKSVGRELLKVFRGEDVACRYGGDEFTIVLPEAALADAWVRADQLRVAVKQLNLQYEGKPVGLVTLSVGVAAYPDHGMTAERLLLACDTASYSAKSEGRDRIIMARKSEGDK